MFDTIIRGGTVIDGTGSEPKQTDIGISKGFITKVGDLASVKGADIVDAKGKLVTPGFIDIHSHADLTIHLENHEEILQPLVTQGITTFIGGNCGVASAPVTRENRAEILQYLEAFTMRPMDAHIRWEGVGDFLEKMGKRGITLNMGLLSPHGILRLAAAGSARRLIADSELSAMKRLLEQTLREGAFGMSTGLQYFPGSQSDTQELISLGKVLKKFDAVFTSHLRSYSHTLPQALAEVLTVGKKNDIHVQISHIYWQPYSKLLTPVVKELIRAGSFLYNRVGLPIPIEVGLKGQFTPIDRAIAEGQRVGLDIVPTSQGFTELLAFFPPWLLDEGRRRAIVRLADPETRKKVRHDIEKGEPDWPHRDAAGWSMNYLKMTGWGGLRVMSVASEKNRTLEGRSFPEIGKELGKHPFDVMADLLIEEEGKVLVFHTPTVPDDPFVARSMYYAWFHPHSSITTDTILLGMGRPSHLFYDAYPRYLSRYCRDQKRIGLAEAVRKCTSLPARQIGIKGRGEIREGYAADIVVMNWEKLGSTASFYEPTKKPSGIDYVFINGTEVVTPKGYQKGAMAGKVLRRGER
jgi:N-acyl-D-amino-acid deacylase